MKFEGVILAAGAGTRFGSSPKLLARLDGRPRTCMKPGHSFEVATPIAPDRAEARIIGIRS